MSFTLEPASVDPAMVEPPAPALVSMRGISKSYGERKILDGISLDVARGEAGQLQLRRSRIPVLELIGPLVRQRGHLAGLRGITIVADIDPAVELHADRELMSRVIENIFDNALRHTHQGGHIEIGLRESAGEELPT